MMRVQASSCRPSQAYPLSWLGARFSQEGPAVELSPLFERFIEGCPVAVMARALLERFLAPGPIDRIFQELAVNQYDRELHFSSVVGLLTSVAFRTHRSV